MGQYKRLALNTFWFTVGNIGSKSINFLMLPIFTRYLLPVDYGKMEVLNTTISLLMPFVSLQLIEAMFRFAVEARGDVEKSRRVLTTSLVFMIGNFFLFLLFHPILANFEVVKQYRIFFYAIFLSSMVFGALQRFTKGIDKITVYVASDILYSAFFAIGNSVLLIYFKFGILAYLLSSILSQVLCILFLVFAGRLYKYLKPAFDKELLKEMLRYSVPLIPNSIMWWIVTAVDRYVLAYNLGYDATGIYSVAARFPTLITVLSSIFFQAWQLLAMEEYGNAGFKTFFRNVFTVVSTFFIFISSLLLIVIKPFVAVYIGGAYSESWRYSVFLILGAVYHIFAGFYGVIYTSSKRTIGAFSTSVIAASVEVIAILSLVKPLGIQAASLSTYMAYVAMFSARVFHTRKIANIDVSLRNIVFSSIILFFQAFSALFARGYMMYFIQIAFFILILSVERHHIKLFTKYLKTVLRQRKSG
ncbi:oligosaccharide flippase family protein [Fervidobacterium sp.]